MNQDALFGRATDEWRTPRATFDELDAEFGFDHDAAAQEATSMVEGVSKPGSAAYQVKRYFGPDRVHVEQRDALAVRTWSLYGWTFWLNPPYSRCREFIAKAAAEAAKGCTVVCLVPSRTDTRWWHDHVWDCAAHRPRPGVEVRFLKGRLKFGFLVTDAIRAAVAAHLGAPERVVAKTLGLPALVVRGIRSGDTDLIVGAPFPSVVIVFRPR